MAAGDLQGKSAPCPTDVKKSKDAAARGRAKQPTPSPVAHLFKSKFKNRKPTNGLSDSEGNAPDRRL